MRNPAPRARCIYAGKFAGQTDLAHLQARQIYRLIFQSVTRHNQIAIIYANCNTAEITIFLFADHVPKYTASILSLFMSGVICSAMNSFQSILNMACVNLDMIRLIFFL